MAGPDVGRVFLLLLLLALGGYLGLAGLLYLFQPSMVYAPGRKLVATPADAGLAYEEVCLESGDGLRLAAWWVPAGDTTRAPDAGGARGTVLFCHGNAGNISHLLEPIRAFHGLDLNTLVFDYRGFGASQGAPDEQGTYLDADAAWSYLVETRGIDPQKIVVYGRSLGGPIAARLARGLTPRGLVLQATFTSIPDLGQELYPLFPAGVLARYHYNTLEYLSRVICPVLVVHSREDDLIPFAHGERLYQAAPKPKDFLEIAGGHGDGFAASPGPLRAALAEFVGGRLGLR